jgi:CBS domain-containing protein
MNSMWLSLFRDRLSAWCDLNPGFAEDELRAKADALQGLEWEELAAEESAEIIPLPVRGRGRPFPFSGSPDLQQEVRKTGRKDRTFSADRDNVSVVADPSVRIGGLPAANVPPKSLRPNQTVVEAITLLMRLNVPWVPVMGGEREVKCVLSWGWIGMRLAQGAKAMDLEVRECKDKPQIVDADTPLSGATEQIKKHGYVLVRDSTKKISGMVTMNDLLEQVQEFLVLREIEHRIRGMIERAGFSEQQLRDARDPSDVSRPVKSASDLTFGEYIRLLESKESWSRLGLSIDRKIFIADLKEIKDVRNDVVHFRGIGREQFNALRGFVSLLQRLEPMIGQ